MSPLYNFFPLCTQISPLTFTSSSKIYILASYPSEAAPENFKNESNFINSVLISIWFISYFLYIYSSFIQDSSYLTSLTGKTRYLALLLFFALITHGLTLDVISTTTSSSSIFLRTSNKYLELNAI